MEAIHIRKSLHYLMYRLEQKLPHCSANSVDGGLGKETFFYGARLFWHSWELFSGFSKSVIFG